MAAGVARCQVLVRADAGTWEARAATDLAHYMEAMSGAAVPVMRQPEATDRALAGDEPVILVGQVALDHDASLAHRLAGLERQERPAVLRRDAIVARREGNRIYLAGNNDDSHYYAAVELLDRWGCRWFLPTDFGESIPEAPTLTVGDLDVAWSPPFEVRTYWLSWHGAQDGRPEFMRRNRMNDLSVPAGHALGAYVKDLAPPGKTAYDVCLSSPETADHVSRQVLARFADGDGAASLGMDDGIYTSACASDRQLQAGVWDKYFLVPSLTDPFMALYNTDVTLDPAEAAPDLHLRFPGLFGEAWLYVDGDLVAHRPWMPLWWHNDYGFEWDVDLADALTLPAPRAGRRPGHRVPVLIRVIS